MIVIKRFKYGYLIFLLYGAAILTFIPVKTYARYRTQASSSDQGRVAAFNVEIKVMEVKNADSNTNDGRNITVFIDESQRHADIILSIYNKGEVTVSWQLQPELSPSASYQVYTDESLQNQVMGGPYLLERGEQLYIKLALDVPDDFPQTYPVNLDFDIWQAD